MANDRIRCREISFDAPDPGTKVAQPLESITGAMSEVMRCNKKLLVAAFEIERGCGIKSNRAIVRPPPVKEM